MFGGMTTSDTTSSKKMFGIFAVFTLAASANAHLFIQYPAPPMEGPIKDPLEADGSNFPCHGADIQSSGGIKMAAGSSQLLQFDDGGGANTATHGGGSCQLSVYYGGNDAAKKDPKNWKVIHSIEGGCPTNAEGNLPTSIQCSDPGADGINCLNQYNFTMPKGVKSGHATFAWTWFNTIGNREIYMNCVNTQIEGGDGSEMDELPSLFVANLAGGDLPQCSTSEGQAYKFPYPGNYVTTDSKASYQAKAVTGGSCSSDGAPVSGAAAGGAAPAGGAASPSSGGAGAQATVTTMKTLTSGSTAPTSAPAPVASSAAPSAAAPAPSSAAAPAPYASGSSGSGSGSSSAGGQSCSEEGAIVCMGQQFGICDHGVAVPQPLAAGTTCTSGKIVKRDHVRRHAGRAHGRAFV